MKAIDLSQAIQKLARLHFRPSGAFRRDIAPAAIADLRISQTETGWVVQTIEDELPKFEIVQKYDSLALPSLEEKESLRAWSAAGKWLFRSLKRRRQILIEIGAFLIRKQTSFLSSKGNLRPLLLSDLAAHLGLHESTLSRALSGKYAETPRGLLPLRSFFASSPQTNQAKALLQQLIDREDKKNPLTDDQISTELKASGYPVARRTIAKYRRELKIGSASSRKHVHPGIL
jgi:RNA polymerase sigma-54 factor